MHSPCSIPASITREPGFADRFWYWRGDSGREYIHSVYPLAACPALPGAVYVAVRREGDRRIGVAAGYFSPFWCLNSDPARPQGLSDLDADEVHVHLLARDAAAASAIARDIAAAIAGQVAAASMPVPSAGSLQAGEPFA
jgi:hypothetical protein